MTKPATEERVAHTPPYRVSDERVAELADNLIIYNSQSYLPPSFSSVSGQELKSAFTEIRTSRNAHEALVSALRTLVAEWDYFDSIKSTNYSPSCTAVDAARAALSLATQKGDL